VTHYLMQVAVAASALAEYPWDASVKAVDLFLEQVVEKW